METQILNKLSPKARELVIQKEARLRELAEENQKTNAVITNLEAGIIPVFY